MNKSVITGMISTLMLCATAVADGGSGAKATYLANAGILVEHGQTKVLFDPLYRLNHGYYLSVPQDMENKLLVGEPPFDGVDVVLVSHFHLDHFSPNLLLNYLMINTQAQLFVPEQAAQALRRFTTEEDSQILERVTALDLSSFGKPSRHEIGDIVIETVRVPHSGWPDTNRGTQNLVYRVTLNNTTTVMHLGDSAPQSDLFERFSDHWNQRRSHMVFAPYWFFLEGDGIHVLDRQLHAAETVGVHVPSNVPEDPQQRSEELQELNLFTRSGEFRAVRNKP